MSDVEVLAVRTLVVALMTVTLADGRLTSGGSRRASLRSPRSLRSASRWRPAFLQN